MRFSISDLLQMMWDNFRLLSSDIQMAYFALFWIILIGSLARRMATYLIIDNELSLLWLDLMTSSAYLTVTGFILLRLLWRRF